MKLLLLSLLLSLTLSHLSFAGVLFDGEEDQIDMGDQTNLDFGTSDFSLEAWIKFPANSNSTVVIAKRNQGVATVPGWYLLILNTGVPYIQIGDGTDWAAVQSTTVVDDNEWHHIVVVLDRDDLGYIYIDGTEDQTADISDTQGSVDSSLSFGIRHGYGSSSLYGDTITIEEVAVYSRILSAGEVASHASKVRRMPLQSQPEGYWPLDDYAGGTSGDGLAYKDYSYNGYNGTGDDGTNNTGLTNQDGELLSYP
jgi:hypothetical protein